MGIPGAGRKNAPNGRTVPSAFGSTDGSQAPDIADQVRLIPQRGSAVRPVDQSARGFGAELIGIGSDADPSQVESIGVPAGLKRDVTVGEAVGVQPAGFKKDLEIGIV